MNEEDKIQNKEINEINESIKKHIIDFEKHLKDDQYIQDKILNELKEIKEVIKPITENYIAASKITKWILSILGIMSIIIGIIIGIKNLLK